MNYVHVKKIVEFLSKDTESGKKNLFGQYANEMTKVSLFSKSNTVIMILLLVNIKKVALVYLESSCLRWNQSYCPRHVDQTIAKTGVNFVRWAGRMNSIFSSKGENLFVKRVTSLE